MSRGHVSGNLQAGVQPLQAFPTGQALNGYAEHVYTQPEGEPPIETNAIRQWRDWPGLRNGQLELRLNNQRAPRVHGLGWGYDPDAEVWRPVRVDSTGALVVAGAPEPGPPTAQLSAWYRAGDINQASGSPVYAWVDRSGNGADLIAIPGISEPTLATNLPGFGGQSAVNLNGSQQLRRLLPPGYQGGDHAFSLYIVAQPANTGSLYAFCWGQPLGTGDNVALAWFTFSGNRAVTTTDSAAIGSPVFAATSSPQIVSVFNGHAEDIATSTTLVDGAVPATLGPGTPGALSIPVPVAEARLGSHFGNASTVFTGKIAEIIVYHKKHNLAERAQALTYLSARYGIPLV